MSAGTTVPSISHPCRPRTASGHRLAHHVPAGTRVTCACGKAWRVTKRHLDKGRVCGCGFALIDTTQEATA